MRIYQYHLKNDYNRKFQLHGKSFYCFSPSLLHTMYIDEDDYKVSGDVFLRNPKGEEPIGTLELDGGISMDVFPTKKRSALRYTCYGYICVDHHKYVRLIKKRFF